MDMVYTNGMMVENMKGNIFMIKKKVLVNIIGTMDDNLKAFGKMAFNMALGLQPMQMAEKW